MPRLLAAGPVLLCAMGICCGVGVGDFFWQRCPALSVGAAAAGGVYRGLFKMDTPPTVRERARSARGRGLSLRGGSGEELATEH
ncbi:hypothetical protein B0H14DRAFT_2750940 [Mycena olivaceomarginata]|nr:hypothetical protein B0H14DRAFT_2750940 [Mycena olivaceomarginata]